MKVNGTLINYYFHCKRQCYLHGNRINLEANSEDVKIGKAIHEVKEEEASNTEISIENIKIDKITKEYLVEIKKSDSDYEAVKWQILFYLKVLKSKGLNRKGTIEFVEKEKKLGEIESESKALLESKYPPKVDFDNKCKKCAYYEYCYI